MKYNKVDEIGKKLDVDMSVIKKEKFKNIFAKYTFLISNALNFILSCTLGSLFGFFESRKITGYPYLNTNNIIGIWGVSSINFLNGRITISSRSNPYPKKTKRILIFILNLFLSIIAYLMIFGVIAYSNGYPTGILYNVYDSSNDNI